MVVRMTTHAARSAASRARHRAAPRRHYLREWRIARGLRQEDLGKAIGSAKGVISRYESGESGIPLEKMAELAEALDISLFQLFWPPGEPSADALLMDESPETKRRVIAMIKALIGDASS